MPAYKRHSRANRINESRFRFGAGIHAREWITPATLTYMIHELVENPLKYDWILDEFDWYFVPVINPDGYAYTHSRNRLWRKTRSSPANALRQSAAESLRADRLARFEQVGIA